MRPNNRGAILFELDNIRRHNQLIVVEGEHDQEALNRLGLERIFILNKTGVSIFNRIDDMIKQLHIKESCVILTDLDKKGKMYYKMIQKELLNHGKKSNCRIREILLRGGVSHIEGLANFLEPAVEPYMYPKFHQEQSDKVNTKILFQ